MTGWTSVKLTQARQVQALMDPSATDAWADEAVSTADAYAALREAGEHGDAVDFIAHALPRLEALAWGARVLDEETRRESIPVRDRQALDHVLRFLGDPSDAARRGCQAAAEAAGERAPERLIALAAFFSGGSISQPELPAVLAPPETTGRLAGTAVRLAAHRSGGPERVIARALELAERVADRGLAGLATE
ncbi:DUF6931 family protein [Sphingomonas sp. Y38-1Y]|uniref:DUF6931 family protein n=1 Tax=Sphingomonas sp. Y38-1Y TaxID=3078265 RepID=UPI0028EE05A6|nr:hypothetical protein [Sphingomonas sp. Y38-1Y]